jgi:hypothetical protein
MLRTFRAYGDWLRKELGGGARGAFVRYRRARQSLRIFHLCAKPARAGRVVGNEIQEDLDPAGVRGRNKRVEVGRVNCDCVQ